MPTLTDELAQLIVQDNAVLFVGSQLRPGAEPPSPVEQITEALAARIDYSGTDRSLPAVAQDFETIHGRAALIQAIKTELDTLEASPDPVHQLIADAVLPKTKVITTRFDRTLERALDQFAKPYVLIVKDKDLPFFDESRITLIKMQGDLQQPDSLVITEDDINTFISRLPSLSDIIRAFFATKTLIFLGYDLESDQFKRFFGQVTHNLGEYRRTAHAIVAEPLDDVKRQYWEQRNVTVTVREPTTFLERLADAVKAAVSKRETAPPNPLMAQMRMPLPPDPYKGLEPFTREDAVIFFGREEERHRLVNRILANRTTVLHGESGSGKTSLLHAGVAPLLAMNRALLATCTPARDRSLRECIRSALVETGLEVGLEDPGDTALPEIVRAWQRELDGPIVLAVDDFERLFLVAGTEEQKNAAAFLYGLYRDRSLNLRLLPVVREDFLGRLETLQEHFPALLDVRFRLERLGREAARAAIEEPAAEFDVRWEPALVERLLDDLYQETGGGIVPPQLQLVCERLYREATAHNDQTGGQFTISAALLDDLGSVETILGDYLERAIMRVPDEERERARTLLAALVSSSGVAQRLPLSDLARRTDLHAEQAATILDRLVEQQLVRRFERNTDAVEYELTHAYLATQITDWLDEGFWAAQRAHEIVQQTLPGWTAEAELPAPGDTRLVTGQASRIVVSRVAAEMLYAAAVTYDVEAAPWAKQLSIDARRDVLLRLLSHTEPLARRRAADRLVDLAGSETPRLLNALVERALGDEAEAVRDAAREALIACSLQDPAVSTQAVPQVVDAYARPATREAAHRTLVVWRDRQPAIATDLPDELRGELQRAVWAVRWQRHRHRILTVTLRGAQGGFWGLALGMGLFIGPLDATAGGFDRIAPRQFVQLMSLGLPIAGLMGALAAGGSAFTGVTLRSLQDRERPLRTWGLVTIVGALMLGLGFLLLTYVFAGDPRPLRAFGAGVLVGLGLGGVAAAPIVLPMPVHLALAAVVGMIVFVLVRQFGLTFEDSNLLWLLVMGATSGVGFFLGLRGLRKQT